MFGGTFGVHYVQHSFRGHNINYPGSMLPNFGNEPRRYVASLMIKYCDPGIAARDWRPAGGRKRGRKAIVDARSVW